MTNFEKFLKETTIEEVAEALSLYFEGECHDCPARTLCEAVEDETSIGCTDVMKQWLGQEVPDTSNELIHGSGAYDKDGMPVCWLWK